MPDLNLERSELAARLHLYTSIVESSPDAIVTVDLDGVLTSWNTAAEQMYGLAATAVLGRRLYDLVDPRQAAGTRANLERIRGGDAATPATFQWTTPDGRLLHLTQTFSPIFDSAGQVIGAVSFGRDITQQTRAEQALRASERKYRMVGDNASDLIMTRDVSWRLTFVSPSVEHILGYTPAEMETVTPDELFAPNEAAGLLEVQRRLLALGAEGKPIPVVRYDRVYRHKNGSNVTLEVVVSGLYAGDGTLEGFISIGRDVTALRATEQALRDTNSGLEQRVAERTAELRTLVAQLEQANAAKDAFLAAVSHELRTPLTGVITLAETLAAQVPGTLNDRQLHYVHSIQSSGERLLEMVNNVLHYTQLAGSDLTGMHEPCRLLELCAASVRTLKPKAERKRQTVELDIEPATLELASDPDGILKVLNALLDNAIKFTPSGGRLGVRVHPVLASATGAIRSNADSNGGSNGDSSGDSDSVLIEVWDTGIGISSEQQSLLFQPFTQLDQRLAREYEGIGLGLAYVKRQVAALGGAVSVQSVPGQGSRFFVTLPMQPRTDWRGPATLVR